MEFKNDIAEITKTVPIKLKTGIDYSQFQAIGINSTTKEGEPYDSSKSNGAQNFIGLLLVERKLLTLPTLSQHTDVIEACVINKEAIIFANASDTAEKIYEIAREKGITIRNFY